MKKSLYLLIFLSLIACKRNVAPTCIINSPLENSVFLLGDSINVIVDASDIDGIVSEVRFLLDEMVLGTKYDLPFKITIHSSGLESGNHTISAIALDDKRAETKDVAPFYIAILPAIKTLSADSIDMGSARIGGEIISDESSEILETGIYFDTDSIPEKNGNKIEIESNNGIFSYVLSGLDVDQQYYYRAYAITSFGEFLGDILSFNTTGVIDIDGNLYKTIDIGEQRWMAENLIVSKYNDGTDILLVNDNAQWEALNSPACCWPENNSLYGGTYGKLYNGYTIIEKNICPTGWHIPSDEEWIELERFLGISSFELYDLGKRGTNEGGMLKDTGFEHWDEPNEGATDSYGFSALPAGFRYDDGSFSPSGNSVAYWASTIHVEGQLHRRGLGASSAQINRGAYYLNGAFSIRCLKDE